MKAILLFPKTITRVVLSIALLIFAFIAPALYAASYELDDDINYNFDDISATGTTLIENCDDCARAVDIGFDFTYYGRVYTQLYVGANGFVLPGGSAPAQGGRMGCCAGRDIPQVDNMVGVMALWWTDLSLKAQDESSAKEEDGKIYSELLGSPGNYVLIVQYDQVRHFHNLATDDANTFQLKIFQNDNHIEFHYKNLVANQNIHTIGIESPNQDDGIKFFRTSKTTPLPSKTKNFALSFTPPENVKLTSSLRYGAEGNILSHIFEVNQNVDDITEIDFSEFAPSGILTEEIDFLNAVLLNNNPAQFSLDYTLFEPLNEAAGTISADEIEFKIVDDGDLLSVESQTVLVTQAKLETKEEFKVTDAAMNHNATSVAFKSKNNLKNVIGKSDLADDVFFRGPDPDTLATESYQLTLLSATDKCGPPYIDDNDDYSYLFVMCTTGGANQIELIRYDLDSYLDDDLTQTQITIPGSVHVFSGDVNKEALVVGGGGKIAYTKDVGSGEQDIYLVSEVITVFSEAKVNTVSGNLTSLSMSSDGTKLVYVLDNTAYFYTNNTETVISSEGVESAHISADGSMIVFNSTSNALEDVTDNSDGTLEIFTVPTAAAPTYIESTMFRQKTDLVPEALKVYEMELIICEAEADIICNGSVEYGTTGNKLNASKGEGFLYAQVKEVTVDFPSGTPKADVAVNFTLSNNVGDLVSANAITNANGLAIIKINAGDIAGAGMITASANPDGNLSITSDLDFESDGDVPFIAEAYNITVKVCDSAVQTGAPEDVCVPAGTTSNPLDSEQSRYVWAQVLDDTLTPKNGVSVTFTLENDVGTLSPRTAVTDAQGQVSVALRANTVFGGGMVTVSAVIPIIDEEPLPITNSIQYISSQRAPECKFPIFSEHAKRIVTVCNRDLLGLGNVFVNREAVFVIEKSNQEAEEDVVHLISAKSNASTNISRLTMTSDGASVIFEDGDEENAFTLLGMSKLDSRLEENTEKNYPIPFKLPGDGKNGTILYLNILFLMLLLARRNVNKKIK